MKNGAIPDDFQSRPKYHPDIPDDFILKINRVFFSLQFVIMVLIIDIKKD